MVLTADRKTIKDLFKEWDAISEVFSTPLVLHPGGWEDTLPGDFQQRVIEQRLAKVLNGGWDTATDAEVVGYLSTACLVAPFDRDWTEIYLYETALLMPEARQAFDFIPDELSDWQKSELSSLKGKIRNSQIRRRKSNRKEKHMAGRKLVMEEHDGNVLVGVQKQDCDPVIRTITGDITDALQEVPAILTEAEAKWSLSPKNPAYVAPKPEKKTPAPAAQATQPAKAEDLPLLADAKKTETATVEAGTATPEPEQVAAVEAAAEEKAVEAVAETAEPQAEPAAVEPETPGAQAEPEATPEAETTEAEEETTQAEEANITEIRERIATAPAPQHADPVTSTGAKTGEMEYMLKDGRGPFETVQLAMDAMGMDNATRPQHNRWDRLSSALKEQIIRRPKS